MREGGRKKGESEFRALVRFPESKGVSSRVPADQPLLWASLPPSACLTLQRIWDTQSPMAEDGVRHTGTQPKGQARSALPTSPSCLHPRPRAQGKDNRQSRE